MPGDSGHYDPPAEAALAPFRAYAAWLAWTGETAAELMRLGARQGQLGLAWSQTAGHALAAFATATIQRDDLGGQTQETAMRVSECMTREVQIADPNDSLVGAAKIMAELDAGILPVGENDRLVGMITDRDIAVRGVAAGMGPNAKVGDVMNAEVKYCFDDQEIDEVLAIMGDLQLRRLPVLNRDKRLVGIISLGDLASNGQTGRAGHALSHISRPGGLHSQTAH